MLETKLVAVSMVLFLGLLRLQAQTNVYLVLDASFHLTAQAQASPQSVTNLTITTPDLIQAIGAASNQRFSPQARLLLLFRDIGGVPFFVVHDGTNEFNTAEYLTASQLSNPIARLKQGPGGEVTGTVYVEEGFRLVNLDSVDFELQGFNLARQSNRGQGNLSLPRYGPTSLLVTVAGPGTVGGIPAVVRGFVLVNRRRLELRADPQ